MDGTRQKESIPLWAFFCVFFLFSDVLFMRAPSVCHRQRDREKAFLPLLNFTFLLLHEDRRRGVRDREKQRQYFTCCSVKLSWHSVFTTYCNAAADLCECVCVCVYVSACEWERETKRQKEMEKIVMQRMRQTLIYGLRWTERHKSDRQTGRAREREKERERERREPAARDKNMPVCLFL